MPVKEISTDEFERLKIKMDVRKGVKEKYCWSCPWCRAAVPNYLYSAPKPTNLLGILGKPHIAQCENCKRYFYTFLD